MYAIKNDDIRFLIFNEAIDVRTVVGANGSDPKFLDAYTQLQYNQWKSQYTTSKLKQMLHTDKIPVSLFDIDEKYRSSVMMEMKKIDHVYYIPRASLLFQALANYYGGISNLIANVKGSCLGDAPGTLNTGKGIWFYTDFKEVNSLIEKLLNINSNKKYHHIYSDFLNSFNN